MGYEHLGLVQGTKGILSYRSLVCLISNCKRVEWGEGLFTFKMKEL